MLVVSWFVCGMLYFVLYSYLFSRLICGEKFKLNASVIIGAMVIGIFNILLLKINFAYLRPYVIHTIAFVLLKIIYKQKFIKTLLGVIFFLGFVTIAELFFGIMFIMIFKFDSSIVNTNYIIYILTNLIIFILIYFISKIKLVIRFMNFIIEWNRKNEVKSMILFVFSLLTISIFLLYNNFMNLLPSSFLLLTNLFCIAVFVFVIGFFKEKTSNNKIIYEYDQLLDYVKVYEKLLEEKSKNQHEYKNQLVIIRDTTKKDERTKYINNILNVENTEEDSEWLRKLKYIPQGGLKGLIYYKIQIMLKNNISVLVSVSEELNDSKKWEVLDNNLSDISKIIGVYLDNAIEATNETKEKYITISVYLENGNIIFDITNTYRGIINITKIDKEGYSTKGNGKGYGLSLVKDIINKNNGLKQKRIINGSYYSQLLYIKK